MSGAAIEALGGELGDLARRAISVLVAGDVTIATAESLTGGLLCAALTSVPGASAVVRGGVVVYATDLKADLAGVAPAILERHGPVAAETASALATGVRERLGADLGVATTGVAGPDSQGGRPPGTVYVALARAEEVRVRAFDAWTGPLPGDRDAVRAATVRAALEMIIDGSAGRESWPTSAR
ncbi:MAG TPA: CinA family protein [Jiangellaceae bacterium]